MCANVIVSGIPRCVCKHQAGVWRATQGALGAGGAIAQARPGSRDEMAQRLWTPRGSPPLVSAAARPVLKMRRHDCTCARPCTLAIFSWMCEKGLPQVPPRVYGGFVRGSGLRGRGYAHSPARNPFAHPRATGQAAGSTARAAPLISRSCRSRAQAVERLARPSTRWCSVRWRRPTRQRLPRQQRGRP